MSETKVENRLWICWEQQRRNEELARAFECNYVKFEYEDRSSIIRYIISLFHTCRILLKKRYSVIFAACPSVVLCLFLAILKIFFKFKLVLDAHNAATNRIKANKSFLDRCTAFAFRKADAVIITNQKLVDLVKSVGGTPLILPDKLPVIRVTAGSSEHIIPNFDAFKKPIIVLVCSFCHDEPIETFLTAATNVADPFTLLVTGKKTRAGSLLRFESDKIHFLDYVPNERYDWLILNCDLMVVLTTNDDCLVCGAYEATRIHCPVILSDTEVLRATFPFALYSKNSVDAYQVAINEFLANPTTYKAKSASFEKEFEVIWEEQFQKVKKALSA